MIDFLRKYKWPLAVFLAAFLIRLIYLIQSRSNPSFYFPMVDEQWHFNWAKDIITGNFWGSEAYFRGPLYPYFLAILLKITGTSILWSRILQMIIPSLSAALIYLLGVKSFSHKVGIVAALAFAAYGAMIFYDAMFMIESLFIFLNLLALYLLLQYEKDIRPLPWLISGAILGLSAITRPNILLIAPLFLLWIYFRPQFAGNKKSSFLIIATYLIGILIPILTVTVRNYIVAGEPILISSQGGVNFYIGNNPDAEGLTMLMPEVKLDESLPWNEFTAATRKAAERETGKNLTAGEESSFWTRKALGFIWNNPAKFISLTFRKLIYFLIGFENSDNQDIYFSRNYSSLYSALLWHKLIYFPFGLLFPLAVVGAVQGWKRRRELTLYYIFVIGYIPTVIFFLVTARHRLPVIPFLLIFAALGILAVVELFRRKDYRKALIYFSIFIVLLIFCNRRYFDIGFQNISQTHFNQALAYEQQGNLQLAEQEYRAALEENPNSATTLNNLGFIQYRTGRLNDAFSNFNRAIQADSKFAEAYNNLGLVLEAQNDLAQAELYYKKALNINPEMIQAYINLGDIYLAQNDYIKSEVYYLQAKQSFPTAKEPYFKLGALYARKKEFANAEEMFLKGEQFGKPSAYDYVNWGNIYYATRQPSRAIPLYEMSISADSTFPQAYFNLALTYQAFGYPPDSAKYYLEKLLRINPQFQPAREMLEKMGER